MKGRRPPARDALSQLLQEVRLDDSFYCRCDLSGAWGLELGARPCVAFHLVADGRAWIRHRASLTRLEAGDAAFVVRGDPHALVPTPRASATPLHELPIVRVGARAGSLVQRGAGAPLLGLCGGTTFDPPDHPLLHDLPDVLVLRGQATATASDWLRLTVDRVRDEVRRPGLASETFVTRLVELLLLEALRQWAREQSAKASGWWAALRDPRLGPILARMHREPEEPLTLDALARAAGMSRSVFAERFATMVGQPPMQYLTHVRMRLARKWLSESVAVGEVAHRLGYASEAAFRRAFRRTLGATPGAVRRRAEPDAVARDETPRERARASS